MKSMADCRVIVAGLVALGGLVQGAWAKTIVVNSSYGAVVFVNPGRHLADLALPGSHTDARFRPVFAAFGPTTGAARSGDHDFNSTPVEASFVPRGALSGLYKEARRFAQNRGYAWEAPPVGNGTSMVGPVPQSDFRAMLLVGAVLVVHQLRRKHRSLKQSLIAG
ncbi:MAG: hypothetical protein JWO52_2134 [Gammaproteobacteria bacterium]|jgi:hypothetical protein|nr:hypothetical protein [Gammaproteobacteria bacterium]